MSTFQTTAQENTVAAAENNGQSSAAYPRRETSAMAHGPYAPLLAPAPCLSREISPFALAPPPASPIWTGPLWSAAAAAAAASPSLPANNGSTRTSTRTMISVSDSDTDMESSSSSPSSSSSGAEGVQWRDIPWDLPTPTASPTTSLAGNTGAASSQRSPNSGRFRVVKLTHSCKNKTACRNKHRTCAHAHAAAAAAAAVAAATPRANAQIKAWAGVSRAKKAAVEEEEKKVVVVISDNDDDDEEDDDDNDDDDESESESEDDVEWVKTGEIRTGIVNTRRGTFRY